MAPTVCAATCASSVTRSPGRCRWPLTQRNCLPASILTATHPARRIRHPTLPGCSVVTVGGCLVEPDNEHDEDEPAKGAEPADDGTGDGETLAASLARRVLPKAATLRISPRGDKPIRARTKPATARPLEGTTRVCCCLLYTSPSPRDGLLSRMPSSA